MATDSLVLLCVEDYHLLDVAACALIGPHLVASIITDVLSRLSIHQGFVLSLGPTGNVDWEAQRHVPRHLICHYNGIERLSLQPFDQFCHCCMLDSHCAPYIAIIEAFKSRQRKLKPFSLAIIRPTFRPYIMVGPNKRKLRFHSDAKASERKLRVVTRHEKRTRGRVTRDMGRASTRHVAVRDADYGLSTPFDEKADAAVAQLRAAECARMAGRAIECADACDSLRKSAAAASGDLRDMLMRAALDQLRAAFANVDGAAQMHARLAETSTRGESMRVVIGGAREHYVGVHLGLQKAIASVDVDS